MGLLGGAASTFDQATLGGMGSEAWGWFSGPAMDFLAGGGQTNVNQYDKWEEDRMNEQRANQLAARGDQQWLQGQYKNQIAGKGPSVAENQMRAGNEQAMQNQLSMARSGRGPLGNAGAQYNAQVNLANQSQGVNRDAATLRAQEQLGAMQNYGQLTGQMRGQDIDMFGGEAGWQKGKADVWADLEGARAEAEESYKTRRGSGVSGAMGAAGGILAMV